MTHNELLKFAQALLAENTVFRRENAILRKTLKLCLMEDFIATYDMDEAEAEKNAEREITHMILHNEGAE